MDFKPIIDAIVYVMLAISCLSFFCLMLAFSVASIVELIRYYKD